MENSSKNNTLVYILSAFLTIFVGVGIYIYTTSTIIDNDTFHKQYKDIEDIGFIDLPVYIQTDYIKKYDCPTKTKTITTIDNTKVLELQAELNDLKNSTDENEKLTEAIVESEKFKVAKCYDMKLNSSELSNQCIANINKLFQDNKDIKYIEVIGLLDNNDLTKVKNITKNEYNLLKLGLSTKRVEETIWYIKDNLSSSIKIFPANYTINSKYNHKGTIVRAYF
jgi:hypothetical protein